MPRNESLIAHQSRRQIPYRYSREQLERAVLTEPTWLLPVYGTLFRKVDNARVLHLMAGTGAELPISRAYFGQTAHIFAADNNHKVFEDGSELKTNAGLASCEVVNIDLSYEQAKGVLVNKMGGTPQAIVLRHPQLFDSLTTQSPLPNAMTAVTRWIAAAKSWGSQMLLTLEDESESDAIETELKRAKYKIGQDFQRLKLTNTPPLIYRSGTAHLDRFCKLLL